MTVGSNDTDLALNRVAGFSADHFVVDERTCRRRECHDGVISTGAGDDLQCASELIRQMVMRFGMSERLGHLTYGAPHNAAFLRLPFMSEERNYSEKTEATDEEVRISDRLSDH
jgi:hypothetical protein